MSDSPLNVLLVEDDAADVKLIRAYLREENDVPLVVEDVDRLAKGLDRLEQSHYDVVLLDLGLPDSTGLETVRQVLAHRPAVPVVVLTGAEVLETALQAVRAGAADYLYKGRMDGPLLLRAIRFAVERVGRRRAVAQLQDAEVRYRTLFEQSPDGVALIDPGTLRAVEFNDAAPRQLGYARAEFAGLCLCDYDVESRPPHTRQWVAESLREGPNRREAMFRTKSGELRHMVVTSQPIELSGRPVLYCVFRDITEVKAVQDSLLERERRYGELLAAVTNYTYKVDVENGRSVWTTHGEGCISVTGYSPSDYEANSELWLSMVANEDRDVVLQQVESVLQGSEVKPIEHRITHREGGTRWVRSTLVQHRENGIVRRYDGVIEDITERKIAEEIHKHRELQLIAAQKIQKRLLPPGPPQLDGYDIGGDLYPAEFAAGDYYDYLPMRDGALAVVIGDVSGHSFASALIMASAHVLLRLLVESHADVAEIFSLANSVLVKETEERRFVTMFLGRMDLATRSFTYANAAHPPGCILDAAGRVKASMPATEIPLGIKSDSQYKVAGPIQLEGGDILVLVTDGILDCKDPQNPGDYFRMERTLDVVRRNRHRSAQEIATRICREARAFSKRKEPEDDTTAVVIKVLRQTDSTPVDADRQDGAGSQGERRDTGTRVGR